MIVCILIPGFIKSYDHIKYLQKLIQQIDAEKIYVFGHIFNYIIEPNINKEKIIYNSKKKKYIDINKLAIFTSFQFVSNDYKQYDKDGYDNRIYSQWYNIKESFNLYLEYSKKNNIKCDIFIRMRSDINIKNINVFNKRIKESYVKNKMMFTECHKENEINDQLFIGPYIYFSKIILLSDNIYNYYLLDEMKERIKGHKKKIKNKKNNPHSQKLRFGGESEILLWTHINKVLNKEDFLIKNKIFSIKKR